MKKPTLPALYEQPQQNPVAKFMPRFNKARTFHDKTQYRRNAKHKNQEPFPMPAMRILEKALA